MDVQEVRKLDAYLKRVFGNPKIRVVPRPKKDDSAEVYIGEEFIGVLFVDDEDDDRSFLFQMAILEDDVSILHGVTLGGTGKENEDRHPKIRHGVMIGAGAKILGNIEIGHCARIAAGSVVVKPVPNNVTVAGVPAKIIGEAGCAEPSRTMDQMINALGL